MPMTRRARLLRLVLLAVLLVPSQGTSCVGPPVFVVQRYELSRSPDSGFVLPARVALRSATFELPAPPAHWWSDRPPRALCDGFESYRVTPGSVRVADSARHVLTPPYEVEARVVRGERPALVLMYRYRMPLRTRDTLPGFGRAVAEEAERFAREAGDLAGLLARGSGATARPVRSWETRSLKEAEAYCRAAAAPPT